MSMEAASGRQKGISGCGGAGGVLPAVRELGTETGQTATLDWGRSQSYRGHSPQALSLCRVTTELLGGWQASWDSDSPLGPSSPMR